ncbi:MAG: hypothetical protein IJP17_01050, partial [Clostridia bacterium]|nr:hypothetical protein [Clostridia bacterium]
EDAVLLDSFYNLERINVTDDAVYQPLSDYCKARGDVSFVYNISLCGTSYDSDTAELTLSGATAEDVNKLPFFTNLASVDVTDGCTAYDELLAVREAMPDCDILWKVDMFGVEVLSSATEMIINEHPVASFDECVKLIGYLPNLTYAEMCDCKLSNRQMESLIEKFPNIDFVWKIYFGRWSARTDIVAFSTLNHGASEFGEDDFAPLFKYCTDLEVLDLGHNSIRDISAVTNLQKLEVLIVMDNFISDMTPVAQLPNLVYAELYTNPWRDASFIADMKAIRDLNIANCFIADYSFLNDLPATLENIWISDNFFDVPSDEMREIRKKNPNCAIEDFWPATWYENRWYNERWAGVKTACDYWQYVTAYDYWDNITFDAPADVVIEEHEQRYKPPQEETSAETEDTDSDGEN